MSGSGDMPYRWDDSYGARLGVLRRDDPHGEVRWFEIDPCYVFHVANAYDMGATPDTSTIVIQAVRYPELWRGKHGSVRFAADTAPVPERIRPSEGT